MASSKVVTFEDEDVVITDNDRVNDEDGDEFFEITTSEAESFVTSDEDDAEFIPMALEHFQLFPTKAE